MLAESRELGLAKKGTLKDGEVVPTVGWAGGWAGSWARVPAQDS